MGEIVERKIRIDVNLPDRKSISTPIDGFRYSDHEDIKWGYFKTNKNKFLGLISEVGLTIDAVFAKYDEGKLRSFTAIVGEDENPIIIWRRFFWHSMEPGQEVIVDNKRYSILKFLEMDKEKLLQAINSCELKRMVILESYHQNLQ